MVIRYNHVRVIQSNDPYRCWERYKVSMVRTLLRNDARKHEKKDAVGRPVHQLEGYSPRERQCKLIEDSRAIAQPHSILSLAFSLFFLCFSLTGGNFNLKHLLWLPNASSVL